MSLIIYLGIYKFMSPRKVLFFLGKLQNIMPTIINDSTAMLSSQVTYWL